MIVNVNKEWMNRVFSEAAVAAGTHRAPLFEGNRLSVVHEDGPGDTKVRRCAAGGPLRLGEKVYDKGLDEHWMKQVREVNTTFSELKGYESTSEYQELKELENKVGWAQNRNAF